jgi:hypothetical protein
MRCSFKGLFSNSTKNLPFYFVDFGGEILDSIFVTKCFVHIDEIQGELFHSFGFEKVNLFSRTAIEDLVRLKNESTLSEQIITIINYIQFYLTSKPVKHAVMTGQHNEALRWINYSLSDDLTDSQTIQLELDRLYKYIESETLILIMDSEDLAQWVGDFYYVCRRLSAYHNIAEEIIEFSYLVSKLALDNKKYEAFIWAHSGMIAWATTTRNPMASKLVLEVENILKDIDIPSELEAQLILCLTTAANMHSRKSKNEWAQILLSKYKNDLRDHQKLQALVAILSTDGSEPIIQITQNIRNEISSLKHDLNERIKDEKPSTQLIEQDRLFEMISPIFDRLLKENKITLLFKVLFDWYQVFSEDSLNEERTLLLYPNGNMALKMGVGENVVFHERDISSTYPSLIKASNEFLGVSHSIRGVHNFKFWDHLPDRMGIPNEGFSDALYTQLVDFYGFEIEEIKDFMKSNIGLIESYICLPSKHHPIQYLMQKTIDNCWPLGASLKKANPDRSIVKVCLWCGAGSSTEQIETQAIESIFEKLDVEVNIFNSQETTKEEFIKIYESNDFDIIWVMSHGKYDHWKPGDVAVEIGRGEYLTLDEAMSLAMPKSDLRRLLFLNICDGGTHSSTEGIERLGLAPALANNQQCVISHLWPVTGWSAATFGVIYSSHLTYEGNFFDAFKSTLQTMALGNNAIIERLTELNSHSHELLERLHNQNNNFDLMAHSGSGVFIQ